MVVVNCYHLREYPVVEWFCSISTSFYTTLNYWFTSCCIAKLDKLWGRKRCRCQASKSNFGLMWLIIDLLTPEVDHFILYSQITLKLAAKEAPSKHDMLNLVIPNVSLVLLDIHVLDLGVVLDLLLPQAVVSSSCHSSAVVLSNTVTYQCYDDVSMYLFTVIQEPTSCHLLAFSRWPLVWKIWQCRGIWQLSWKYQGFY